jgi:hypothetical protein
VKAKWAAFSGLVVFTIASLGMVIFEQTWEFWLFYGLSAISYLGTLYVVAKYRSDKRLW